MVACMAVGGLIWVAGEPRSVETLMGETGPVERLTTVSYFLDATFAARSGHELRTPLAAVLALAKTLDRMMSILSFDLGVHVPLYWVALRSSVEECLELGLSLLLLLGLAQYRAARR